MHYYQHHIGDYKAATSHLTNEEDIAYRRLLEMYYDTEQSIPDNKPRLSRVLRVTQQAVEVVLNDFFVLLDGAWVQSRCQLEISSYQSMKNSGKDGADKRWGKGRYAPPMPPPLATQSPPQSGGNANHEPLTNNHEPITIKQNTKAAPDGVSTTTWADFQKHRKAKKAPITETVMAGIKREADKAGWTLENALIEICARGWTGFNAEWVTGKQADTRGVLAGAI